MQSFFKEIRSSVWDREFYASIPTRTFGSALIYITKLGFLLSLIATIGLVITFAPGVNKVISNAPEAVKDVYPDELVVTINDGIVSTNVEEPYMIPIPQGWKQDKMSEDVLLVIDTKDAFSLQQFNQFHTVAWVTKDAVITRGQNGKIEIQDLRGVNLTISEQEVMRWVDIISPYFKFLLPILALLLFIGMLIISGTVTIKLLIVALFVLLLGKLMKKGWNYKLAYKISLFAATLPFALDFLAIILGVPFGFWIYSLVLLVVVYVNYRPLPVSGATINVDSHEGNQTSLPEEKKGE
jgi:hypothetical protein